MIPVLDSSAQTAWGCYILDFCCKTSKRFFAFIVSVFYLERKSDFQGFLGTVSDLLAQN